MSIVVVTPFKAEKRQKDVFYLPWRSHALCSKIVADPRQPGGRGKKLACGTPPRLLIAPRERNPRRRPAYASGNSIFQRTTYLYTSRKGISPYTIPKKTRPPKQLPS